MIAPTQKETWPADDQIDWGRIVNYLAQKALARRRTLPRDEVRSLAGLAVAIARVSFDPAKATCGLGVWACGCGWMRLRSLIRDELMRRRRERAACFSDLDAAADPQRQAVSLCTFAVDNRDALWSLQPDWLGRLSPLDRRLVQLRADGETLKEMSLRLGQTIQGIRSRLKRICRLLVRLQDGSARPAGQRRPA